MFILDLRDVMKMDSSGIGEAIAARGEADSQGGSMALLFSTQVESLLEEIGLGGLEGICHTFEEALEYVASGRGQFNGRVA